LALGSQERQIILDELTRAEALNGVANLGSGSQAPYPTMNAANAASSASMISMIFRFFLQSGEYRFFMKRLKNVISTKVGNTTTEGQFSYEQTSARQPNKSYSLSPGRQEKFKTQSKNHYDPP